MEEKSGEDGRGERAAGGDGDSTRFIQWLTTIHKEIDSTADTLKDEANTVKARRITPNLEILMMTNERRAGNGRARRNAVIGLDDAIAKAIKNLQNLRTSLREESQQLFNVPVYWMDTSQMTCYTQAIPGASATASKLFNATKSSDLQNKLISSCSSSLEFSGGKHVALSGNGVAHYEDETSGRSGSKTTATDIGKIGGGESGGGRSQVQVIIPPGDPVPEPLAGCSSHVGWSDGRVTNKQQKKADQVDMSVCHSLSPSLSGVPSSKYKDPKDLLSPECWTLAFDKVEDPRDWFSLYQTSPYFQDVVGDKRTTALFPQVLPHVIPYVRKDLDVILGLRLVCRGWKTAVDNLLGTNDSAWSDLIGRVYYTYGFGSPARISSFLQRFETHAGNPFVGRCASFEYNYNLSSEAIEEYHLLVSQLLEKFGGQLKSLCVRLEETRPDNVATRLERCIQLVPNLDSLFVDCYNPRRVDEGKLSPCITKKLLPKLKSISFRISGYADRAGILNLQNAVVRLCCSPDSLKNVSTVGFPPALDTFPNLKSADVILSVEEFSKIPSTPWPLSKLTVSHNFDVSLGLVFKCVEHFKGTLSSLRFMCPLMPNAGVQLNLDLPHLKQLTIEAHPWLSLEFLTNLRNLEVLSIHHSVSFGFNAKTELPRLIEYFEGAEVWSRLWEHLPKLSNVCLFGFSFLEVMEAQMGLHLVATRSSRKFQMKGNQRLFQ